MLDSINHHVLHLPVQLYYSPLLPELRESLQSEDFDELHFKVVGPAA